MIEFDNFLKSENLEFDLSEFDQAELFQALTLTNQVQAKTPKPQNPKTPLN